MDCTHAVDVVYVLWGGNMVHQHKQLYIRARSTYGIPMTYVPVLRWGNGSGIPTSKPKSNFLRGHGAVEGSIYWIEA